VDSPRDVLLNVLNGIASIFADFSSWLLWTGERVAEWWIVDQLAPTFTNMGYWFADISWWFIELRDPILRMYDTTLEMVTLNNVWDYFKTWFEWAEWAWDWVSHAWSNVWSIVEGWWQATSSTVQGWIDIATQGLDALKVAWSDFWNTTWPQWTAQFNTLSAAWTNFWTVTFPTLVDFSWLWTWWNARLQDINNLVNTAFTLREKLWEGWQELRNQVTEFFSDPEDWLYKAVDRIIERFW